MTDAMTLGSQMEKKVIDAEVMLAAINTAYAFISAGRENQYGHPHQETEVQKHNLSSAEE